ncbi:hypothetical protein AnigIFM56816_008954 [Aspergillus niger]|nr:hypothetical protein AnigIFM56816_008954 [Aspergillus niger]
MRLLSLRRRVGQLTDCGRIGENIPGVRYMTIDLKIPRRTIQAHNRRLIEVNAKMAKPASLSGFGFDGGVVLLIKLFPTLMDIARVNLDELLSVRGAAGSLCTVNVWMAWIILPMTGAAVLGSGLELNHSLD